MVSCLRELVTAQGYQFYVAVTGNDRQEEQQVLMGLIADKKVAGILQVFAGETASEYKKLMESGVPFVCLLMSGNTAIISDFRPTFSFRSFSITLSAYPVSRIIRATFFSSSGLTYRVRFITWDTVAIETPAISAICLIVIFSDAMADVPLLTYNLFHQLPSISYKMMAHPRKNAIHITSYHNYR